MEKEKVNLALYNTVMHGIFLKRHPVKAFFKFFQHMAFFKCRSTVIFLFYLTLNPLSLLYSSLRHNKSTGITKVQQIQLRKKQIIYFSRGAKFYHDIE